MAAMARDKILLEYNGGKADGLKLNFTLKELKKAKDFKFTSKARRNKAKKSIYLLFFIFLPHCTRIYTCFCGCALSLLLMLLQTSLILCCSPSPANCFTARPEPVIFFYFGPHGQQILLPARARCPPAHYGADTRQR